jgi:hypothetical protein
MNLTEILVKMESLTEHEFDILSRFCFGPISSRPEEITTEETMNNISCFIGERRDEKGRMVTIPLNLDVYRAWMAETIRRVCPQIGSLHENRSDRIQDMKEGFVHGDPIALK